MTTPVRRSPRPILVLLVGICLVGLVAGCDLASASPAPASTGPTAGGIAPGSGGPSRSDVPASPGASPSFARPSATPESTAVAYTVVAGDNLNSIARKFSTTARSIAFWNGKAYPSLDPYSAAYSPDMIEVGWTLAIVPGVVVDEGDLPAPSPTAVPLRSIPPGPTQDPSGASVVLAHGSRDSNAVALTFDMGGRLDPALEIVDWLIEHDVRATIFPTGATGSGTETGRAVLARIAAHPDLFAVGNHSWDHPDFTTLTPARMVDQLTRTEAAIGPLLGGSTKPFFRPPYGSQDAAVRAAVGGAGWSYTVMWDVDTIDWKPTTDGGPTADDIAAKVAARVRGGSIVLMHLGGYHTLEALPEIVTTLRSRGLEPVTLPELIGR
jgi:peptidoglycan/xylan/chitin deacetylase (PgdA/CDA1 family)